MSTTQGKVCYIQYCLNDTLSSFTLKIPLKLLFAIFFITREYLWNFGIANIYKNNTNHPILRNSHNSVTASNTLPQMGGGYKTNIIFTKYEAVHPTAVLENYSSLGMLTILIKVQTLSI